MWPVWDSSFDSFYVSLTSDLCGPVPKLSLKTSGAVDTKATAPATPVAVGFWAQRPGMFSFLLAMHNSLGDKVSSSPEFDVSSVGDVGTLTGHYGINSTGIKRFDGEWRWLHRFSPGELGCATFLTQKSRFFQLVESDEMGLFD